VPDIVNGAVGATYLLPSNGRVVTYCRLPSIALTATLGWGVAACGARSALTVDAAPVTDASTADALEAASMSGASDGAADAASSPDAAPPPLSCGPGIAVCPGDTCDRGRCTAMVLATAPAGIVGMAIDDSYVYFTDNGDNSLRRVPKCGGDAVLLAQTQNFPGEVVALGGSVFWNNQSLAGSIESIPRGGGATQTLASWTFNEPRGLVADASRLYFSVEAGDSSLRGVSAVALDGGAVVMLSKYLASALALDDTSLYGGSPADGGLNILRIPKSGGDATSIVSTADVNGIAVDATHLYWTTRLELPNGTLSRIAKSGGPPTILAMLHRSPGPIALDDRCVYWGDNGYMPATGTIGRVPISGGPAETLAGSQDDPMAIALDAESVYWVTFSGNVMRAPK
jgi:hypothetical protein